MTAGITKGPADVRRELFGGRGEVRVWNLLTGSAEPFQVLLSCELSGGGSVGRHVQERFPEVVVGVGGNGQASVDGHELPLGPGDVIHVPLGAVLSILNQDAEAPLHYLIIKARGLEA